ncbi:Uncharacterised protein g7024 [Pycnogonum litorale]
MKKFRNFNRSLQQQDENETKLTVGRLFLRFLFSYFGLFLLVVGYSMFGAWLFVKIELPAEELRKDLKVMTAIEINHTRHFLVDKFWTQINELNSSEEWKKMAVAQLKSFEIYIVKSVDEVRYDGSIYTWEYDWQLMKSLLYSVTITSTIGYGHVFPKTDMGKIATILYAIIGIPLLLVFLANIGDGMAKAFRYSYSRLCCRWCRSRRKNSEYSELSDSKKAKKKANGLNEESVGNEDYMPTNKVVVPIVLNLIIMSFYVALGTVLFSFWENWDLVASCYFTFVTFSTIGFGDMVPGNSFLDLDDFTSQMQMLTTCLYVLFGMAMLSMCISLMQEQIVSKVKYIAKEVGLIKESRANKRKANPDASMDKDENDVDDDDTNKPPESDGKVPPVGPPPASLDPAALAENQPVPMTH